MARFIKINNCRECPHFKDDRYAYCGKLFDSCPDAYRDGRYWDWYEVSGIDYISKWCPLENENKEV